MICQHFQQQIKRNWQNYHKHSNDIHSFTSYNYLDKIRIFLKVLRTSIDNEIQFKVIKDTVLQPQDVSEYFCLMQYVLKLLLFKIYIQHCLKNVMSLLIRSSNYIDKCVLANLSHVPKNVKPMVKSNKISSSYQVLNGEKHFLKTGCNQLGFFGSNDCLLYYYHKQILIGKGYRKQNM